jgi:hypothetical protein
MNEVPIWSIESLKNDEFMRVARRNPFVYRHIEMILAGQCTEMEALQSMVIALDGWGMDMQKQIERLLTEQTIIRFPNHSFPKE